MHEQPLPLLQSALPAPHPSWGPHRTRGQRPTAFHSTTFVVLMHRNRVHPIPYPSAAACCCVPALVPYGNQTTKDARPGPWLPRRAVSPRSQFGQSRTESHAFGSELHATVPCRALLLAPTRTRCRPPPPPPPPIVRPQPGPPPPPCRCSCLPPEHNAFRHRRRRHPTYDRCRRLLLHLRLPPPLPPTPPLSRLLPRWLPAALGPERGRCGGPGPAGEHGGQTTIDKTYETWRTAGSSRTTCRVTP